MRFDRKWTGWCPLSSVIGEVETAPGAYVVRVRNQSFNRFVGTDKLGILDIGETGNLRSRLRDFIKCAKNPKATGHMAAWRYSYLGLGRMFPLDELEVRWSICKDKEEAVKKEAEVMRKYVDKHYELPPLNYKFNWSE